MVYRVFFVGSAVQVMELALLLLTRRGMFMAMKHLSRPGSDAALLTDDPALLQQAIECVCFGWIAQLEAEARALKSKIWARFLKGTSSHINF